jgi:hypothetical protein
MPDVVTALPPKDGSFKAVQPHGTYLQSKVLEAQAQYVNRRILISIQDKTTIGTLMHSNTQILFDQLATVGVRAHFGCVLGLTSTTVRPASSALLDVYCIN